MPAAAIVTLGDVADITCADARQAATMAAIELFPAPAAGEEKVVRVREIQDLLLLRGVNPASTSFSGASEVAVEAAVARPRPAGDTAGFLGGNGADQAAAERGPGEVFERKIGQPTGLGCGFRIEGFRCAALCRPAGDDRGCRRRRAMDRHAALRACCRRPERADPRRRSTPPYASLLRLSWPSARWPAVRSFARAT